MAPTDREELQLLDEALKVMADFHATFQPANDAELTPQSTPAAFRAFCDALASLHYRRHHMQQESADEGGSSVNAPVTVTQVSM